MAQIKGKHFYINYHDGVIGLAPERVFVDLKRHRDIILEISKNDRCDDGFEKAIDQGLEHFSPTPVFTFVHSVGLKGFEVDPWFTGDSLLYENLVKYIKAEGGVVNDERCAPGLMVPLTMSTMSFNAWASRPIMRRTCRAVATESQFEEEFGVTTLELMRLSNQGERS